MSKRKGNLSAFLDMVMSQYLDHRGPHGGDSSGYWDVIEREIGENPLLLEQFARDALKSAAKRQWQKKPRDYGPDLFSIGGEAVPEYVTRPANGYVDGEDEHGDGYQKVGQRHATVHDLVDNATIKSRKASEAGAAAKRLWDQADEARKRAKGNMAAFAKDIADIPE